MLSIKNMTKPKNFRLLFAILVALAVCIRLVYVLCLPLGQKVQHRLEGLNDEPSHLNYVHYLAEHKQFPVQNHHARENDSFIRNEFEYYQPPVYYMLGAGCELLVGKANGKRACRFLSFFLGVLSLLVIYKIFFRLGFPGILCQGAVLFAAFLPVYAYFCSVVSNDSLCWLVCLLLTLEICAGWAKKPDVPVLGRQIWFSAFRTGALLGIGMLIKSSLFIFYPVVALFFLYRWYISKDLQWIGALAASFILSGFLSGPWYLYNLRQYGSLFAFGTGNGPPQFFLFSGQHFTDLVKWTLYYFWFPMQHVPASHIRGVFLWCEAILVCINGLLTVLYIRSRKKVSFFGVILCFCVLVNAAAYCKFNLYWSNAEGRYFLPSLVPILVFFCVPLYYFCKRFRREDLFLPLVSAEALAPYLLLLFVK